MSLKKATQVLLGIKKKYGGLILTNICDLEHDHHLYILESHSPDWFSCYNAPLSHK